MFISIWLQALPCWRQTNAGWFNFDWWGSRYSLAFIVCMGFP